MEFSPLQYKFLAALTGVLVALAFVSSALFLIRSRILASEAALANEMFSMVTRLGDDSAVTLRPLNELGFEDCSEENLLAMRGALFESNFAKQIVFYQNNLGICTTGSGLLDTPIARPPPDFQTYSTAEIWVDRTIILRLTQSLYNGIIIKIGNYSMMADSRYFDLRNTSPLDWELVYQNRDIKEDPINIYGSKGLFRQRVWDEGYEPGDSLFYYEACDTTRTHYCVALTTTIPALVSEYKATLALIFTSGLALDLLSGLFVLKRLQSRRLIEKRIVHGFKNNAYYWVYQPIADLETHAIIGCEVLSRFRDKYGELLPDEFLPVIRESGHTWRLTEVMIGKVFSEVESLEQLPDNFKISLNIFPHDVLTGEVNKLVSIPSLTDSRFNTVIEITEDEYLDAESAQANLKALYQSGIEISIDDFGTGYSNLKQLKKIHCHYLKIDRSFVMEIEEDSIKSSLIPHVLSIAAQLNLKVIAEGIENLNQQQVLAGLGVKYGQGWVFGKPVSATELAQMTIARNMAFVA